MNTKYIKAHPFLSIYALLTALCFCVPPLVFIVFLIIGNSNFISTLYLEPLTYIISALFTLIVIPAVIVGLKSSDRKNVSALGSKEVIKKVAALVFAPFLIFGMTSLFIQYPVNYILHKTSDSHKGELEFIIENPSYSSKGCRGGASIGGAKNKFIYHRRICGIPEHIRNEIKSGTVISITGDVSKYGIIAETIGIEK